MIIFSILQLFPILLGELPDSSPLRNPRTSSSTNFRNCLPPKKKKEKDINSSDRSHDRSRVWQPISQESAKGGAETRKHGSQRRYATVRIVKTVR